MKNRKKLYIHGSFMNDNYGDFLLYYVILKIVEEYNELYDWFSSDVDPSYDKYCKVNRKDKKSAINDCDLAIFAGGGYFGEPSKYKLYWNIRCLLKHMIPAYKIAKRKIPYILVGVETGPLSLFINRIMLRKICNNSKIISVRNIESKEFLEKIGVKNQILVNPDWIMGIDNNDFPIENVDIGKYINDSNKYKIIFLHLTTSEKNEGMKNVVNDLIKFQKENQKIKYIIGCDQCREKQNNRARILYDKLNDDRNIIMSYDGPWKLSKVLKNVDAVITDKLHVGIVSTKYGKEVISVASHPKSIKFYKLINRESWTNLLKNVRPNETYNKLRKLKFSSVKIDDNIFLDSKNNKKIVEEFLNRSWDERR